jgi:hypothetical protein
MLGNYLHKNLVNFNIELKPFLTNEEFQNHVKTILPELQKSVSNLNQWKSLSTRSWNQLIYRESGHIIGNTSLFFIQ